MRKLKQRHLLDKALIKRRSRSGALSIINYPFTLAPFYQIPGRGGREGNRNKVRLCHVEHKRDIPETMAFLCLNCVKLIL